jgi:tetratricopeptide (TPR) repeat protein
VTGPITVEIEKEEFIPSTIIITDAGNANIDINQKLNPLPKVNDADKATGNLQDSIALNKNLEQVFEAQRLVRVGRTDEAMDLLEKVNNNYPQLASIHEMKGGIYYLQKSYAQAQDEYKKVISMIPENVIAQQMLKKIELQIAKNSTAGQAGGPPAPTDQPVKQAPEAKQ